VSFAPSPIGEEAFNYMPEPERTGEDLLLYCVHLAEVDALLAVAVRATIEHYAESVGIPVSLDPPEEPGCRSRLLHFLGDGLPDGFALRGGGVDPEDTPPDSVIMPVTLVPGYIEADQLTDRLARDLGERFGARPAGYLAGALAVLVENAIDHGDDSSVDPLAAVSFQAEEGLLRLAVADTGKTIESDVEADQRLVEALAYSEEEEGGLAGLGSQAKLLGIDAQITIAAGNGRLRWRQGEWEGVSSNYAAGTSAMLDVKL
jgi:hypothetical protein